MEVTYVSCVRDVMEGEVHKVQILFVMILPCVHVKLRIRKYASNSLKTLQRYIKAICGGLYDNACPQEKRKKCRT